jgi:hypothetical protein
MNRHERVYRRLLAIFPTSFRERYEEQMVTNFADRVRDIRASGSDTEMLWLWLRSLGDIVSTAPRVYLQKASLVPRPVDAAAVRSLDGPARRVPGKAGYALALLPLWSAILLGVVAPDFMTSLLLNPPSVLGYPLGIALTFGAGLLMALGVLAMRLAGSPSWRTVAFVVFTIPSLILIVLAPAIALVVANLRT